MITPFTGRSGREGGRRRRGVREGGRRSKGGQRGWMEERELIFGIAQ